MTYIEPHMRSALTGHTLTPIVRDEAAGIEVWRMARAGTRAMSVQIAGTPEGICLMGDIHPGPNPNGCCSTFGKDLRWFAERKSEDYLCSKFLLRTWVPKYAAEVVESWLDQPWCDWSEEGRDLVVRLRHRDCDERQFYEALDEWNMPTDDGLPGYGYPPEDAGWLCAIQERFSALYERGDS